MDKIQFSCNVFNESTVEDLALEFWLDNHKFFDQLIPIGTTPIQYSFVEDEEEHCIKIVLKNKTIEHTTVDENNNILSDAVLEIKDVFFDQLNTDYIFNNNCIYTHNFNGNGEETSDSYYGSLGCNGVVEFKFSLPFYLWLLENM